MRKLLPLLALALCGCGVNPGTNPDPVDVTCKVTLKGRSIDGVTLNFQPTGNGTQAILPVKNGEVKAKLTPGKYTWFISEGRGGAFRSVPENYRAGSLDRQIEISDTTSTLDLTVE